jgi:hypothetical protein
MTLQNGDLRGCIYLSGNWTAVQTAGSNTDQARNACQVLLALSSVFVFARPFREGNAKQEGECASLTLHHVFEPCFDRRPLALDDAVVDRMAIGTIGQNQMIAQHSLFDRSQALNSSL